MAAPKVAPARLSPQRPICKPLILTPEEMRLARQRRNEFWCALYGKNAVKPLAQENAR